MISDGHVRVLPPQVANRIAAGEVVERPASVVKELAENAVDAGAKTIRIMIEQGGRRLVAVQDDGCGMTREDAVLALERQATSKISDVDDIEHISTLGFRGEAIPSIASVSRFSITTRRHDSDEGVKVMVNAGVTAGIDAAGCPPGTLVEVRDLFCNVPARRKFLKSVQTEEARIREIFTVLALANPAIAFSLACDGREMRLAAASSFEERLADIFGPDLLPSMATVRTEHIHGYIERPSTESSRRREQYIFINGRAASAPIIGYAIRESYPHRLKDVKPALFLFINVPPGDIDINVHPAKREVRFRKAIEIRNELMSAISAALTPTPAQIQQPNRSIDESNNRLISHSPFSTPAIHSSSIASIANRKSQPISPIPPSPAPIPQSVDLPIPTPPTTTTTPAATPTPTRAPATTPAPWAWFHYLATTSSGYILIETDSGLITINPLAARERIAYDRLMHNDGVPMTAQDLLIPEIIKFSPTEASRILSAREAITTMGFRFEEFGVNTFKVDAVPQIIGDRSPSAVLTTIANDLGEGGVNRGRDKWREELVARSIARSFAGCELKLDEKLAVKLVEDLAATTMPYIDPRRRPIMIFTSNRDFQRKFALI